MHTTPPPPAAQPPVDDTPLRNFSDCHAAILSHLRSFGELPQLLDPAARARTIAQDMLEFFRGAVFEHHAEEERVLFPAVLASAQPGEEHHRVQALAEQLSAEHRAVEHAWNRVEPELRKVAKGQATTLDAAAVSQLIATYRAHASFEEAQFLPLAQAILGRNHNHMAALDLSLHLRHGPQVTGGYV